jgi:hypothetical protein
MSLRRPFRVLNGMPQQKVSENIEVVDHGEDISLNKLCVDS